MLKYNFYEKGEIIIIEFYLTIPDKSVSNESVPDKSISNKSVSNESVNSYDFKFNQLEIIVTKKNDPNYKEIFPFYKECTLIEKIFKENKIIFKYQKILKNLKWETLNGPLINVSMIDKNKQIIVNGVIENIEEEKGETSKDLYEILKEIYKNGSVDVKNAMDKSFIESGGRELNTNWNEVNKTEYSKDLNN